MYDNAGTTTARIAFRDTDDLLIELDLPAGLPAGLPINLSGAGVTDTPAPDVASGPVGGYLQGPPEEGRHLFVRDHGDHLWQRTSDDWIRHDGPGAALRSLAPAAALYSLATAPGEPSLVSVFSFNVRNRPVEFRQRVEGPRTAAGGPRRLLALADTADDTDGVYDNKSVRISGAPGSEPDKGGMPRTIFRYGGRDRVVRLDGNADDWPNDLAPTSRYQVLGALTTGTGSDAVGTALTLDTGVAGFSDAKTAVDATNPQRRVVVRIIPDNTNHGDDQYGDITVLDGAGLATVAPVWAQDVAGAVAYEVFEVLDEGLVGSDTFQSVILPDPASPVGDDFYNEGFLRIVGGAGLGQTGTIVAYNAYAGVARLDWAPTTPPNEPNDTTRYRILGPHGWLEYENPQEQEFEPILSWEYWNGKGWISLGVTENKDETNALLNHGKIRFRIPEHIEQTEVAGQQSFWIRARLIGGDYGRETFTTTQTGTAEVNKDAIDPPIIERLRIEYQLATDELPQRCLTYNNLSTLDQTAACSTPGKHFEPFQALEDEQLAVYLGFERPLVGGPVGVLFVADELPVPVNDSDRPKMTWFFRSANEWKDVKADDATEGLVRQEVLTLNVPAGFQIRSLFGNSLYWIRGSLVAGEYVEGKRPRLRGVFPNTAMTFQSDTVRDEILGSSNGEAGQEFLFLPAADGEPPADRSIIDHPEIRVREFLSPEEAEDIEAELGEDGVLERDVLGELQTWVRWTEVDHFFESTDTSRHYRLDRARARVSFGDGRRGMIPPAGVDNVRAFSYRAGGGLAGNVGAGKVNALVTAVAGIDSILNPVEAGGGGNVAPVDEMLRIGPARISHRDRAVTPEDFEWLALEASRQVVKTRCRPNFQAGPSSDPDDEGRSRGGWVTVYIVPRSNDDLPRPSLALQRTVQSYLEARAETGLASKDRIAVRAPRYVPVSVEADVFVVSIDRVAAVELDVNNQLRDFLHPLRGGPEREGWEFGRPLAVSDLYVLLEAIDGVDHVENLQLRFGDRTGVQLARIRRNELIAWADPLIRVAVA